MGSTVKARADHAVSPFLGLRYPLIVAAIAVPLFAIYSYPYPDGGAMAAATQAYLSGYTRMVGAVLSIFDPSVVVITNRIAGRTFSMSIVKTCDAMEVNILLSAALAGFPMPILRRCVTVFIAILALVVLNILRLCALYWLGAHAPTWFDRTHQTLAPLFMVAFALAIFLIATLHEREGSADKTTQADVA